MARTPLYKTTEAEMLRRIASGDWPPGLRLGNEFDLAAEFGVSQGTMRRALMAVEAMGYLDRKPGRGTMVAQPRSADTAPPADVRRLTRPDGSALPLTVFRARLTRRQPEGAEAALFDGPLHVLARTLKSGADRFALEEIVLPVALAPEMAEDQPAEFADLLAALGLAPARIDDRLHAEVTDMATSVALACDRYTGLLCLTRLARDRHGTPLARQILRMAGPATYAVTLGPLTRPSRFRVHRGCTAGVRGVHARHPPFSARNGRLSRRRPCARRRPASAPRSPIHYRTSQRRAASHHPCA